MSVRTGRPPPPRSKPPPPPPAFAPPPLPRTPALNVYQRNEKTNPSETEKNEQKEAKPALPPKFRIEEVKISEVATQPQVSVLRSQPDTFNFTLRSLKPKKEEVAVPGGEEDDLVPEIRNKCHDVNEILNRILSKDDDFELENKIEEEIEHSVNTEQSRKLDDPFVNIDNIADLTLEEVREILDKEEQTNSQLKENLVSTKEEKLSKYQNQPKSVEKSRKRREPSKPRKSKKEQQLEKLKDFLKDPDAEEDQEVELDIRLKKSGKDNWRGEERDGLLMETFCPETEQEEISQELTEICEGVYLASVAAAERCAQEEEEEYTVIQVGSNAQPRCKNTNLHIELSQEGEDITTHHLQSVSKCIADHRKRGNKVVITSNINTGIAACFCISYLVTVNKTTTREAVSLVQRLRPRAKIPTAALLKIEEPSDPQTSYDDSLTSLSQSWLPTIFFLLLSFLFLRALFHLVGFDRTCLSPVVQFLQLRFWND